MDIFHNFFSSSVKLNSFNKNFVWYAKKETVTLVSSKLVGFCRESFHIDTPKGAERKIYKDKGIKGKGEK